MYIKYREPYIYLAHLSHNSALVAWGKFFFDETNRLVDDDSLLMLLERRRSSIGEGSESYGEHAVVTVTDMSSREVMRFRSRNKNYCWLEGLNPDTKYRYELEIDDDPWAAEPLYTYRKNERREPVSHGYNNNEFRTFPSPDTAADLTFAVIGDFGDATDEQQLVAEALASKMNPGRPDEIRFIVTTGDNIYKHATRTGVSAPGVTDRDENKGADDDDWFYTFFQPYRFVINRIPTFPTIGNHDTGESDETDDRKTLYDNLFIVERFPREDVLTRPGLTYRFKFGSEIEMVAIDSSKERITMSGGSDRNRCFLDDRHAAFLGSIFTNGGAAPMWRIPFLHHPAYSKGDRHGDTSEVKEALVPLWEASNVNVVFCGHDHNKQYLTRERPWPGSKPIHHLLTGGGGSPRDEVPRRTSDGTLVAWGGTDAGHFLVVKITGNTMRVEPVDQNGRRLRLRDGSGSDWNNEIEIVI